MMGARRSAAVPGGPARRMGLAHGHGFFQTDSNSIPLYYE